MSTRPVHRDPAEPAAVFLSYARDDEAAILPLERAIQERGLRVLRDKPNLPLGAANVAGLTAMIEAECDAALFYATPAMLKSDFIWRHEVPAALGRQRREAKFRLISVLHGLAFGDLAVACADRGLPSLADFNAEMIPAGGPTGEQVARIARRTLQAALDVRLDRDGDQATTLGMCLRTFPFTPPVSPLHLDLEWTASHAGDGPTIEQWRAELLPALADVARAIALVGRGATVDAWVKARLPAAVALGHPFPHKGSSPLRPLGDIAIGTGRQPAPDPPPLDITRTLLAREHSSAMLELAISREIAPAVTRWRSAGGFLPGWRVRFSPAGGPSREAITDDAQARRWARQIGDQVRGLWDAEGVDELHLFTAAPAVFAVLVGQQLRERRPVHIYYGDDDMGYRLAFTLNERPG